MLAGEPRYRVEQVWQGLYEQLAEPEDLTSVPLGVRRRLAEELPHRPQPGDRAGERRGRHRQAAVGARGRRPHRDGADALPGPRHRLRLEPGRLRDGVRLLRHRAGRLRAPPEHRGDRGAGGAGGATVAVARPPALQRGVHGHGRAVRQRGARLGRGAAAPRRPRALGPQRDHLHRGPRAGHPQAGDPAPAGEPRRLAPRRRRRAARRARPHQPPVPARRPDGRLLRLPPGPQPAAVVRVGADRRRQRPRRRRRPARRAVPPAPPASPRQPHPAQPDARLADRRQPARARVRAFRDRLRSQGVNATIRRNRGTDIDAACGQLAAGHPVTILPRRP